MGVFDNARNALICLANQQSCSQLLSKSGAALNYKIGIFHEPEDDNEAHAALRSLPRDDMELLERLATGAWADWILNKTVQP